MSEFVSNYDQPIKFIIGFAGSGKSTRLAQLCKEDKTLVLTPTHQAASVLQSKGLTQVYTIHSVLKLVPTINQNFRRGQKIQKLKQIGSTDLSGVNKIAIDEFSMISTDILDKLLAVLPTHCEVYVFGDSTQLKPVDGDPIEPEMYTDNIERLIVQHRADNPDIVETFMRFHKFVEYGTEMNLKVNLPRGTIKTFNPKTDRILAYTNKRVIELNTQVANMLNLPDEISEGEDIIANGIDAEFTYLSSSNLMIYPTCISKGKLMDGEKLYITSRKTQLDIDKFGTLIPYPITTILIDGTAYNVHYDINYYENSNTLKKEVEEAQHYLVQTHNLDRDIHLPTWCKENPGFDGVKERARAWSRYLAHQNLVFDIRRPFATTVHKSQGKEFSKVFIDQEDIKLSIRNNYYETYARLMYVALSRAINEVIILS